MAVASLALACVILRGGATSPRAEFSHLLLLVSRINKRCVINNEFRLFSSVRLDFYTTHKFTSYVLSVPNSVSRGKYVLFAI